MIACYICNPNRINRVNKNKCISHINGKCEICGTFIKNGQTRHKPNDEDCFSIKTGGFDGIIDSKHSKLLKELNIEFRIRNMSSSIIAVPPWVYNLIFIFKDRRRVNKLKYFLNLTKDNKDMQEQINGIWRLGGPAGLRTYFKNVK